MPPARRGARPGVRTAGTKPRAGKVDDRENPQRMEVAEVIVEIQDLSTFQESINILVYGPSGHGKTDLIGSAPNATFLSTESGTVTAKMAGSKAKLMRVPTWEHVVKGIEIAGQTLGPKDWLLVDSVTKMQRLFLDWILRMNFEGNSNRDRDIPAIQDHQKWQNGFMRFVDTLVNAPYNTIMTATQMHKEDEEGDDLIMPHIIGKNYEISDYVQAQVDVMLHYSLHKDGKKIYRRALAQPDPPYRAKDRFSALGYYQDVDNGDHEAMADFIGMIEDARASA